MEFCCGIMLIIAATVTADTGSSIRPSQQDTCSVPVDVITELQTLRSLQNQDSKMTLDLGKQVMDLQKELHQLRTEYSLSLVQTKDTTLNLKETGSRSATEKRSSANTIHSRYAGKSENDSGD